MNATQVVEALRKLEKAFDAHADPFEVWAKLGAFVEAHRNIIDPDKVLCLELPEPVCADASFEDLDERTRYILYWWYALYRLGEYSLGPSFLHLEYARFTMSQAIQCLQFPSTLLRRMSKDICSINAFLIEFDSEYSPPLPQGVPKCRDELIDASKDGIRWLRQKVGERVRHRSAAWIRLKEQFHQSYTESAEFLPFKSNARLRDLSKTAGIHFHNMLKSSSALKEPEGEWAILAVEPVGLWVDLHTSVMPTEHYFWEEYWVLAVRWLHELAKGGVPVDSAKHSLFPVPSGWSEGQFFSSGDDTDKWIAETWCDPSFLFGLAHSSELACQFMKDILAQAAEDAGTPETVTDDGAEKGAERFQAMLPTAVTTVIALRDLYRLRYFYPTSLEAEEVQTLHDELVKHLESVIHGEGYEELRELYKRPVFEDVHAEPPLSTLPGVLLLHHPAVCANADEPEKTKETMVAASQDCQKRAFKPVQQLASRICEIMLMECRIPEPDDDPTYHEPLRFLHLLREYWGLLRRNVLNSVDANVFHEPHPALPLLVNLQERIGACFGKLADVDGAEEAQKTVEALVETLLSGDPEELQVAEEWTMGCVHKVEMFLANARLKYGTKSYVLTSAEETFCNTIRSVTERLREESEREWQSILKRADEMAEREKQRGKRDVNLTDVRGREDGAGEVNATDRSPLNSEDQTSYCFKCDGEFWLVQFDREHGRFKGKGFDIIHRLLQQPDPAKPISALDLLDRDAAKTSDTQSFQPTIDEEARAKYRQETAEYDAKIAEARHDHDDPKVQRLEREKQEFLDRTRKDLGLGGSARALGPQSPAKKAYDALRKRLTHAYKKLEKAKPPLTAAAKHLLAGIDKDSGSCTYAYRPRDPVDWSL